MKTANMTFSGLQRYARIVETVLDSNALLGCVERVQLIHALHDAPGNPSVAEIEAECEKLAEATCGDNMLNAGILNRAQRGY